MTDSSNQRKAPRFDCSVPVDGQQESYFGGSQTIDISKDGIGFISDRAIPIDAEIPIELSLDPDEEPVLVRAIVKWVNKIEGEERYRIGMRFKEVISGSRRKLSKHLKDDMHLS